MDDHKHYVLYCPFHEAERERTLGQFIDSLTGSKVEHTNYFLADVVPFVSYHAAYFILLSFKIRKSVISVKPV